MTTDRAFAIRPLATASFAAALLAAGAMLTPVPAAEPAATDELYAAIYAEELCGSGAFSQAQWQRLVGKIGTPVGEDHEVGDMLSRIDQTKSEVADVNRQQGCGAAEIKLLRGMFERDLRPAL